MTSERPSVIDRITEIVDRTLTRHRLTGARRKGPGRMARCKMDQPERAAYLRVFCAHLLTDEDFETLTREEMGSACFLMFHMWTKQGSLPNDPARLSALARCTPEEFEALRKRWPKLVPLETLDSKAEPGARVTIPYLWREWMQVMTFYEAQKERSRQGVEARKAATLGVPLDLSPIEGPMGIPMGAPLGIPNQDQDQDQDQAQEKNITPAPRKRAAKPKVVKLKVAKVNPNESLEDILGGGKGSPTWEAYWKLVTTFGGGVKNPAPKTTARLYRSATLSVDPRAIQAQAEALAGSVSDLKYLPQLQKWLEGAGYANPTVQVPARGRGGGSPSHRAGIDEDLKTQLRETGHGNTQNNRREDADPGGDDGLGALLEVRA